MCRCHHTLVRREVSKSLFLKHSANEVVEIDGYELVFFAKPKYHAEGFRAFSLDHPGKMRGTGWKTHRFHYQWEHRIYRKK